MRLQFSWQTVLAAVLGAVAIVLLPITQGGGSGLLIAGIVVAASVAGWALRRPMQEIVLLLAASSLAAFLLIASLNGQDGAARLAFFLLLAAAWLLAWRVETLLSHLIPVSSLFDLLTKILIPLIFGAWLLILWEAITRGAGVPMVVLPSPSAIGAGMGKMVETLIADVIQTIFKSALTGYVLGSAIGFLMAIIADRFDFMRRGLLPIGNVFSALPIVGIAPIMVSWFGPDWPSKAAVVVVMTVFPMLVNTVAGLKASSHMERDLMRTYASGYWQTLWKLRLPAATPFIFNALKINSTLAMIGAIIAEFFTTPTVGLGFRVSTEIGLLRVNNAWAEIAVAALISSVFYAVIALVERAATFWHPSMRRRDA